MRQKPADATPSRARRHYRQPSRLAERVAPRLGLRPGSVEQLLHGHSPIHTRFWALVEAAIDLGDERILAMLTARGEVLLGHVRGGDLTRLELAETELDGEEDRLQMRYRCASAADRPTIARERVTVIDRLRRRLLELRQALVEVHGL